MAEISKSLKKLTQIQKERLDLEKEVVKEDKKETKMIEVFQDKIIGKIGKDEKMQEKVQKEFFKMLGVKEKIDIDGIDLGGG